MPGVFVWEIDNLLPVPLDDIFVGKFFEGDCYIVMYTCLDETHNLAWKIHYWIGNECTVRINFMENIFLCHYVDLASKSRDSKN